MPLSPEKLEAIQFWRAARPALYQAFLEGAHAGPCPFCRGGYPRNHVRLPSGEQREALWCLCQCPGFEQEAGQSIRMLQRPLRAGGKVYRFADLAPRPHPDWPKVLEVQRVLDELLARPWDAPWVTLMGKPGNGKSHLLLAAYAQLRHLAAYVYADALADALRQAIANNAVADLKDAAIDVPILILDDLGTEYQGSDFIASAFNAIISQRYLLGRARPTLVATNLTRTELLNRYERMADRLLDRELVRSFGLGFPSWRSADSPPAAPTFTDLARPGTDEE